MKIRAAPLAALLLALALPDLPEAAAATVYRCGPDGREYRDSPCADGHAVDMADPRSPDQVAEARRVAALERRLADRLAADRTARESAAAATSAGAGAGPSKTGPRTGAKPAAVSTPPRQRRARPSSRPEGEGTFRAVAPSSRPTKD